MLAGGYGSAAGAGFEDAGQHGQHFTHLEGLTNPGADFVGQVFGHATGDTADEDDRDAWMTFTQRLEGAGGVDQRGGEADARLEPEGG